MIQSEISAKFIYPFFILAVFLILSGAPVNAGSFLQVDAGYNHSCGLTSEGQIGCWGNNFFGQISPPQGFFTQVSAGGRHSCGVTSGGSIRCWGSNEYGQSSPPSGSYSRVVAGGNHSCGLSTSGNIKCWGLNQYRQASPPAGTFTRIDASWQHSCAVSSSGSLACWGDNYYGQSTPIAGVYTEVTVGTFHSCAINTQAKAICWGSDYSGQRQVPDGFYTRISAGSAHVCGLKTDGSIVCWGWNSKGQAFSPSGSFKQLNAGGTHNCAVTQNSTAVCWGDNAYDKATPLTSIQSPVAIIPAAPGFVSASDGAFSNKVQVSWSAVSGALHYFVYRSNIFGSSGSIVSPLLFSTRFDDTNVSTGTTYYYSLVACNASGCSVTSQQDSGFAAFAVQPIIPSVPAAPIASDGTVSTGVQVVWTGVADASFYQVLRAESSFSAGVVLASSVPITSYLDTTALQGKVYYYSIIACNVNGCSTQSGSDSGFLPAFSDQVGLAVENTELFWTTSGDSAWYVVSEGQVGNDSVRSGLIGDNQSSTLNTQVIGPGELTFYWKVSSEAASDFLFFAVDGVVLGTPVSGEISWQFQTFSIPTGIHDLSWVYRKNANGFAGTDAGWLDNVVFSGCDTVFDGVTIDSENNPIGGSYTLGNGAELNFDSSILLATDPICIATKGNVTIQSGANANLAAPLVLLTDGFQVENGANFYAGVAFQLVAGRWNFIENSSSNCFPAVDSLVSPDVTLKQTGHQVSYVWDNHNFSGTLVDSQLTIFNNHPSGTGEIRHVVLVGFSADSTTLTGRDEWFLYQNEVIQCGGTIDFIGTRQ